jgi:transposase
VQGVDLGAALDWAAARAAVQGFAGVTVSCEPTGHRWRVLGQLAAERSMPFVCVQPMQTSWARRSEDLTFDKADDKDAVLIARLTERRMVTVLDGLELTALVTSIHGISAVGAAAILAETGDPHRFAAARALVKNAGLAPREKASDSYTGRTKLTGQGRPRLRVAAWRAVWGSLQTNTVYAARYRHLTGRERNKLTPTQAQTVIAAAILRHLHAVVITGQAWKPQIASGGIKTNVTLAA